MLDLIFELVATWLGGWVPERQPWRNLVTALCVLGGFAGFATTVWLIARTV